MKKLIYIAFIAAATLCSCDRTVIDGTLDFGLAGETTISVEKSNSTFSPDGGDGYIVVKSETGFKATSSRGWCTLSTEKDSIAVSVEPYDGWESRYSFITVKNEAGDSVVVTVHQSGVVIQNIVTDGVYCNNAGGMALIPIKANLLPKFSSNVSWAVPTLVEEGISVAIEENKSGVFRSGLISCTLGRNAYEIPVAQLDSTDILGVKNWEFAGVISPGDTLKLSGTISRKMTGYGFKLTGTNISWSFDVKTAGNKIAIPLGSSIGRYKPASTNYYVIPVVAEGTSPIKAGEGIDSGYFYIPLGKESAEDKWSGKVENANLRFEFWTLASRPDASQGGFRFKDVILRAI